MTRKDYIKLADLFGASYAHVEKVRGHQAVAAAGKEALHIIQTGIEDICRQDNPRFNRDRFQDAINDAINEASWTLADTRLSE